MSLVKLMFASQLELLPVQASCLQHLLMEVPDLVTVFPWGQLAEILMKMITSLPMGQLTEIKLTTLQAVVKCELFQSNLISREGKEREKRGKRERKEREKREKREREKREKRERKEHL